MTIRLTWFWIYNRFLFVLWTSFYRYVLESELKFSQNQLVKPFAYFHNMPQSPILTMNIHSPESWMVEAVRSPFDLDNICLKEIDGDGVYGQFELEHLIIEGHAYDILSGQSPRGLQFNSGTIANPVMYDTIVMANLVIYFFCWLNKHLTVFNHNLNVNRRIKKGYFQLKASPGMWFLKLREGRSKDIYEIVRYSLKFIEKYGAMKFGMIWIDWINRTNSK